MSIVYQKKYMIVIANVAVREKIVLCEMGTCEMERQDWARLQYLSSNQGR